MKDVERWAEDAVAFQKIWLNSASRIMGSIASSTPETPPHEMARQLRGDFLQGLAEAWDRVMRSPQFLKILKEWSDNNLAVRESANGWMARMRNGLNAPSLDDIEDILAQVRQSEQRILEKLNDLSTRLQALESPNQTGGKGRKRVRQNPQNPKQESSRKFTGNVKRKSESS